MILIMKHLQRATLRIVGLAFALTIASPTPKLHGQANTDSIHLRNDCRFATQILRTGNPANKREWALGIISWCGRDGIDAFVGEWKAKEASADSQTLADMRYSIYHVRDADLFETFLATAQSPTSSVRARVEAWYYLFKQIGPGIILPQNELSVEPVGLLCRFDFSTSMRPIEGRPLPADFVTRVDAAALQATNSGSDYRVRRFGKCVHDYVLALSTQAP